MTLAGKHDQIAVSLIQDILSGHYRVAERLPSERDLAARFEANRGAVREAMKKLEQLGLVDVQPGGARVQDHGDASLDVMGHMLAQDAIPDATLIDQAMVVIDSLLGVAAEQALKLAGDEEINQIRTLVAPLMETDLDQEAHMLARFELMRSIMVASRNMPLRMITRTLFEQIAPTTACLNPYMTFDGESYAEIARQLDQALSQRDNDALRETFEAFSNLNRETMMRAIEAAQSSFNQEAVSG